MMISSRYLTECVLLLKLISLSNYVREILQFSVKADLKYFGVNLYTSNSANRAKSFSVMKRKYEQN